MLITRPNHDLTTNYLFYWSKLIINSADKAKIAVVDLLKKRANYKEFNSVIKKIMPKLIVMNGHGNESVVTGYDNEVLVDRLKNPEILFGAIVYARSCKSAQKLGITSVDNGCRAYIGYDDDFVFSVEDGMSTRPLSDKTAELFLSSSNKVVITLIKGGTVSEANQKSKEMLRSKILQFSSSDSSVEEKELVPLLLWNYDHQVVIGDENSKL